MKDQCLYEKSCLPCEGGMPPLSVKHRNNLLAQIGAGWRINIAGHLYKEYLYKNFRSAMDLANKIAVIADKEYHHPDIFISWGKCGVEIWTHAIHGLTENDFVLAAKIEQVYEQTTGGKK